MAITSKSYLSTPLERKARFISQIASGLKDVRSVDDVGSEALSYATAKATASGNPLILEHCTVSSRVKELELLESNFARQQIMNSNRIKDLERYITNYEKQLEILAEDLEVIKSYNQSYVTFSTSGVEYTDRESIIEALKELPRIGTIGYAFGLPVKFDELSGKIVIGYSTILKLEMANMAANVYRRMLSIPIAAPEAFAKYSNLVNKYKEELSSLSEYIKKPFAYKEELDKARSRKLEIEGILQVKDEEPTSDDVEDSSNEITKPIEDISEIEDVIEDPITDFEII